MTEVVAYDPKYEPYFESGVLDPDVHMRLVGELDSIALDSNIPKHIIHTAAADFCGDDELEWMRSYNHLTMAEDAGLVYTGKCADVGVRMFSVAGALTRNFIRSRVFTVQEVIDAEKRGKPIEASTLLIPNFYLGKSNGGSVPDWQVSLLLGLLYSRYAAGKKTVLFVESMPQLATDYGESFLSHIKNHFKIITE